MAARDATVFRLFRYVCFASFREAPSRKYRRRGATSRIRARARDHAANHVAPPGKNFSIARVRLAKEHAHADVCSECGR